MKHVFITSHYYMKILHIMLIGFCHKQFSDSIPTLLINKFKNESEYSEQEKQIFYCFPLFNHLKISYFKKKVYLKMSINVSNLMLLFLYYLLKIKTNIQYEKSLKNPNKQTNRKTHVFFMYILYFSLIVVYTTSKWNIDESHEKKLTVKRIEKSIRNNKETKRLCCKI
jgi:hypothetical protein